MSNPSEPSFTGESAIIVAHDQRLGIGKENHLPWQIHGDMKFFRETTSTVIKPSWQNAVIMGRKTWQSISAEFRPLKKRINIVLTRNNILDLPTDVLRARDLEQVFAILPTLECEKCFVIGGSEIYKQALKMDAIQLLYVTEIKGQFDCDTFFPEYRDAFQLIDRSQLFHEGEYEYFRTIYRRK